MPRSSSNFNNSTDCKYVSTWWYSFHLCIEKSVKEKVLLYYYIVNLLLFVAILISFMDSIKATIIYIYVLTIAVDPLIYLSTTIQIFLKP